MFFICVAVAAVAGMATAEPGAFISQREVTNADVFQQKQRHQQDAYNGQSHFQAGKYLLIDPYAANVVNTLGVGHYLQR